MTAGGVSNRFRFFVGQLPEINEVEPNSDKDKPQVIKSLPTISASSRTDDQKSLDGEGLFSSSGRDQAFELQLLIDEQAERFLHRIIKSQQIALVQFQ